MNMQFQGVNTDLIIEAARMTRDIYKRNAVSLARDHYESPLVMEEMVRAATADLLLGDDDLCEMLAGRINQLLSGTPKGGGDGKR